MKTRYCLCLLASACTGIIADPISSGAPNPMSGTPGLPPPGQLVQPAAPLPFAVGTTVARRLTPTEYDATVFSLLGDTQSHSVSTLPAALKNPFDNDATLQVPSQALIDGVEQLASDLAARLVADTTRRRQLVGCTPTGAGDTACFRQFLADFGRRVTRRPMATAELDKFTTTLMPYAMSANDFYVAVQLAMQTLLQDLRFLYRLELPHATQALDGAELATRLSYLLWGTTPDSWLLDLADAQTLDDAAGMTAAATRMLADPRATTQVERFHALWLGYETSPLDPSLAVPMRAESDALVNRVVFTDRSDWSALLTFDQTYVPDALATLYGLAPHGSSTPQWTPYGTTGRAGILSQGSFLAIGARFGDTSPTQRGKAVRNRLLCQDIPPPPPNVNTDAPPGGTSSTQCKVQRYHVHATGGCAACHDLMDPVGFGLENYDTQGAFRTHDDGNTACTISGDGSLVGEGTGAFNGPGQLGAMLASTDDFRRCAVTQLYRFAMGHATLDPDDTTSVAALQQRLTTVEPKLDDLMIDFVSSDAFRFAQVR